MFHLFFIQSILIIMLLLSFIIYSLILSIISFEFKMKKYLILLHNKIIKINIFHLFLFIFNFLSIIFIFFEMSQLIKELRRKPKEMTYYDFLDTVLT